MRAARGFLAPAVASASCPPFLAALALHGIAHAFGSANQGQCPDSHGSAACVVGVSARRNVAVVTPASTEEGNVASEDGRESLLQVNSKRHRQPPPAAPSTSEYRVEGAGAGHEGAPVVLLSMTEAVRKEALRPSTLLLVVLILMAIACILLVMVRSSSESLDDEKSWKGFPGGGVALQSGASGAPQDVTRVSVSPASAASLPPTPPGRQLQPGVSPRPPPRAEQGPGTTVAAPKHLCPGLVVPHGSECILAVPMVPAPSSGFGVANLDVQDMVGNSVIQAEVAIPHSSMAMASLRVTPRPLVALRAGPPPAAPLLAYCKAAPDVGDRKRVCIYDARDEVFAQIAKDRATNCYVLTSGRAGLSISFERDPLRHAVNVTNDQRQLLAETTPTTMAFDVAGSYYKLRVLSNVDVGLMICALYSIDCMEYS